MAFSFGILIILILIAVARGFSGDLQVTKHNL